MPCLDPGRLVFRDETWATTNITRRYGWAPRGERMNRTLKDATVRRYHYASHDELRRHLQLFLDAYNHARRLRTLRGLTPYEFICKAWTEQPSRFTSDPSHYTLGLNI